jgi:hypothetical protein
VAIKFGIKAGSVVASAVFALALVAGCNSEEPATEAGAPKTAPGATPPGKMEPKATPPPAPPVTPPKTEEAKPKP